VSLLTPEGLVCGIDEAGRGPLAGPVVAAAVILDPSRPIAGLNDSKKLSARRREVFQLDLITEPRRADDRAQLIAEIAAEIDQLGLGRCTPEELPAWFARAAKKLKVHWSVTLWNSNLRGAKRERALAWMRGDDPSAQVKEPKAATRPRRAGSR